MRITWIVFIFCAATALADSVEMETLLFVQNPHPKGVREGIQVVWVPEPLQKYCLGKTAEECSTIDYCNRTTTRNVPMCHSVVRMAPYPTGMHPRRLMSISYYGIVPKLSPVKGMDVLLTFFQSQPSANLDRLSTDVRIKARVRLKKLADDDDFDVLEFLAGAP